MTPQRFQHFIVPLALGCASISLAATSIDVLPLQSVVESTHASARRILARPDGGYDLVARASDNRRWIRVGADHSTILDQPLSRDGELLLSAIGETAVHGSAMQLLQPGKPPRFSTMPFLAHVRARPDGHFWSTFTLGTQAQLSAFDRHGVEFAHQFVDTDVGTVTEAVVSSDSKLWLLGRTYLTDGDSRRQHYVLKQHDDSGQRWHWTANVVPGQDLIAFKHFATRDGSMLVVGTRTAQWSSSTPGALHVAKVDGEGRAAFARDIAAAAVFMSVQGVRELVDGRIAVLSSGIVNNGEQAPLLHLLAADGQYQQTLSTDSSLRCLAAANDCTLISIGDALFVLGVATGETEKDNEGEARGRHLVQRLLPSLLPATTIAAERFHDVAEREHDALILADRGDRITILDHEGHVSSVPAAVAAPRGRRTESAIRAADGGWFLLQSLWSSGTRLVRHAADGSILWTHGFALETVDAPTSGSGGYRQVLLLGEDLVCVTRPVYTGSAVRSSNTNPYQAVPADGMASCHEIADGRLRFTVPNPSSNLAADGDVLIAVSESTDASGLDTVLRRRFSSSGQLLDQVESPRFLGMGFELDANGTIFYEHWGAWGDLRYQNWMLAPDASTWRASSPAVDQYTNFRSLASGDQLLIARRFPNAGSDTLTRMRTTGHVVWSSNPPQSITRWFETGPTLLGELPANLAAGELRRIVAIDSENGRERWQHDLLTIPGTLGESYPIYLGNNMIAVRVSSDVSSIWIESMAQADGRRLAFNAYYCNGGCNVLDASLDSEHRLTLLVQEYEFSGIQLRRLQFGQLDSELVPIPLDQPALNGTWVQPGVRSQGMMLDWLDSARTAFGARFRDRAPREPGYLHQQWTTVQGTVAPGANRTQLIEYSHMGGEFAGDTDARTQQVGAATLTMYDCRLALLEGHRLKNGQSQRYTEIWRRQSPLLHPCHQSNGPALPADTQDQGEGINGRMAGAWADPGQRDQGILFSMLPKTSLAPGIVFGAWFTFFPSDGAANSTNPGTWLTLQGSIEASGQRAQLLILQSLGGSPAADAFSDTYPIGTATLEFIDCDSLRLNYRFHDADAYPFAGRGGALQLERPGACGNMP